MTDNETPSQETVTAPLARRRGESAFDRWSWVHVGSGAALALLVADWRIVLGLLVAFEGLEGALRRIRVKEGGLFEYESWPNIVGDLVVGMAGFFVIHALVQTLAGPMTLF